MGGMSPLESGIPEPRNRRNNVEIIADILRLLRLGQSDRIGITPKGLSILGSIEDMREMLPVNGGIEILHRSKISEINIGQIFVSWGVANLVRKKRLFASFVQKSLDRYRKGDWGDMGDEEKSLNQDNLIRNLRLFASYESPNLLEIWITTEPDRSSSTVMFPDEDISIVPLERYETLIKAEAPKSEQDHQ